MFTHSNAMEAKATSSLVASCVRKLASKNLHERLTARNKLEQIGEAAVPELIKALKDENEIIRWEAAKALGKIADPSAAEALVQTLTDESFDVRWVAADSLVALGDAGVPALLEALVRGPASVVLHRKAHHILHSLSSEPMLKEVKDVLKALEQREPAVHVPVAAYKALEFIRSRKKILVSKN